MWLDSKFPVFSSEVHTLRGREKTATVYCISPMAQASLKQSPPHAATYLCDNIFHFCLFLCCALLVRHKLLQMSCEQEKYTWSLYCKPNTNPDLKVDSRGGSSSMSISVCPPAVLLVSIRLIPLTSPGQCWSAAQKLQQFAVPTCNRENKRSCSSLFLILITVNPSNGFVTPFSFIFLPWRLKIKSNVWSQASRANFIQIHSEARTDLVQ